MIVFLFMQTWFPSSTDSVDSGNWVNFLECKKFCGIKFALSKDMLQCSENILIGHSCFSVKKYACSWSSKSFDWSQLFICDKKYAFSWSSASGRSEHIVLCHMFRKTNRNVSRCFSFYEELEARNDPFLDWSPDFFLLMQFVVSFLDRFLWILETESISSNAKSSVE